MKKTEKGVLGMPVELLIAIALSALVIFLIFISDTDYGSALLGGLKGIACFFPGMC